MLSPIKVSLPLAQITRMPLLYEHPASNPWRFEAASKNVYNTSKLKNIIER